MATTVKIACTAVPFFFAITLTCCSENPAPAPDIPADLTPNVIFAKVADAYQAIKTYKAEGVVTTAMEMNGVKTDLITNFSMRLEKPNRYRIEWTQNTMGMVQKGAVWSDGAQPYLYMGTMQGYTRMKNDELALGGATGISGGAAATIPAFFLPVLAARQSPFLRLEDPVIEKEESIDDRLCHVIAGRSNISKKETYWIAADTFHILQYQRSLEPPEGTSTIPEMTDEQLTESIKAMGQEVTEENIKKMRAMMKMAADAQKNANIKGTMTERHTDITLPEPAAGLEAFQFTPPEGTELKDSLWGNVLENIQVAEPDSK